MPRSRCQSGSIPRIHTFICQWHSVISAVEEKAAEEEDLEKAKRLNTLLLQTFYMQAYETDRDFYGQFEERLTRWREASELETEVS